MKSTAGFFALLAAVIPTACHAQIGPADLGEARAGYQSSTGRMFVSASDVGGWYIDSKNSLFSVTAIFPTLPGSLVINTNNSSRIGQSSGERFTYTDVDLGIVAPSGLAPSEFVLLHAYPLEPFFEGLIGSVPPPGSPLLDPVPANVAKAGYNPLTGDLLISTNAISSWRLESIAALDSDNALFPARGGMEFSTRDPHELGGGYSFDNNYLGRIAPTGLALDNFALYYRATSTGPEILGEVVLIPEPAAGALLAAGAAVGLGYVRRRRSPSAA